MENRSVCCARRSPSAGVHVLLEPSGGAVQMCKEDVWCYQSGWNVSEAVEPGPKSARQQEGRGRSTCQSRQKPFCLPPPLLRGHPTSEHDNEPHQKPNYEELTGIFPARALSSDGENPQFCRYRGTTSLHHRGDQSNSSSMRMLGRLLGSN